MRKIMLFCSAGMSTSMLVKKMQEAASELDYDADIAAYPLAEASEVGKAADILLLGPQVRFSLDRVEKQFPDKIVKVISPQHYGMMNGAAVIKQVQEALGDTH